MYESSQIIWKEDYKHLALKRTALQFGLALLFSFLAISLEAKTFRFDYERELEIAEGATLQVRNGVGDITIRAEKGRRHLLVQAVKTVHAVDESAAREVAGFVDLKYSSKTNVAVIETVIESTGNIKRGFWDRLVGVADDWFGSVDYVITVPENQPLVIRSKQGALEIQASAAGVDLVVGSGVVRLLQVSGGVMLDIGVGEVTLTDISGSVEITSADADLKINSLNGDLTVHGGSGFIQGEYLTGQINAVLTSGKVSLKEVQGDVRLKATSGNVKITQEEGSLDVFTHTGTVDIKTELFTEKEYIVETLSGDITFAIPENTGVLLVMNTMSGKINTSGVPLEVESFSRREVRGVVGPGGVKINLKSNAGDITFKRF